ncbi:MAG: transcription antitermination factor NusB [Candidatus Omnitrophota bacterium]|jgi:transcription antitermination factor NusB
MRNRTRSRECALQLLYQYEQTSERDEDWVDNFWRQLKLDEGETTAIPEIRDYAAVILNSVIEKKDELDRIIEASADHWAIERMALVDRNILRIGTYEIRFNDDIPTNVAINESIELGKKYGDSETSRFVNGILDKVAKSQ